ncbi:MAG: hypothetical protein K2J80_12030 [Oscillospiraceae bacterium]|nr:hypothetical protein [Oscillospiraceae bacterium]
MIKFEFKKLFIKQYALILIILLVVLKLFSSAELFKPDTSSLSPQQREVYLDYIDKYGGALTDEKEAAILEKYALLTQAKQQMREILDKLNGGEYATTDEYYKALSEIPEIISDSAAIEKLYSGYESVAKDRERRVLLAFDAPAITVGQEYWFLIFICYISAISVYYERKINNLQKASKNGTKTYVAKLLAIFTAITAVWLIFSIIEFSALTTVISKADLSASLASLESFKETPYSDMTILGGFIAVEAVKLVGYLFTAAVTLIIARLSGNLVLSIFSPVAVNVVWIYLFANKTAAFYQPFSLMRGPHYLTGTHYISAGENGYYPEHSEIPGSVLAALIVIAVAVIMLACAMIISAGKNKLKKRKKLVAIAGITSLTMLLGGCSAECSENFGSAGQIAQIGENYYVAGSNIAILDGDLNVTKDRIIRDILETYDDIGGIFADGNYLYYSAEFKDSSQINRINLTDFSEENVYFGDYSVYLGQTKYFDMITAWGDGKRNDVEVKDFFVSGGKIVMSMWSNSIYILDISTKKMTYLFEDVEVKNLCTSNGMIYYTNLTGELICFDGSEKRTVSDRIFNAICADESRVYGVGTSGVFGYDSGFNETVYSSLNEGYGRIRAYDERIAFETRERWVYIDENGERDIGEADDVFVGKNGLIIGNNGKYSFNIVF